MSIDGGEEPVHKMNEPPSDIECDRYWKQDDTAKQCQNHVHIPAITATFAR